MSAPPAADPRLGRLTESRVGRSAAHPDGPLAAWGATPRPPACGPGWLDRFPTDPARLSNGLATDRQWYAFDFTALLVKGLCRRDVVADALAAEGVHPVTVDVGNGPEAVATLWLNVIRDSVCGAYHEVVLSFDVSRTRADAVAVRCRPRKAGWAVLYPNFGPSACDAQFLHSLWIDSPLSITWGREMQGFPKHPRPVATTIGDDPDRFTFDVRWGADAVIRGAARKRFGLSGLVRESWELLTTHRLGGVLGFLASRSFDVPILMPAATAGQSGVRRDYRASLWKGLSPAAVQVWPWAADDELALGDVAVETGCEPHNGQRVLKAAGFRPVSATYVPRAAAFVAGGG